MLAAVIASVFSPPQLAAGDKAASFEGTLSATLTRGGTGATQFFFTRQGRQLRIENTDQSKPEPINIVDLETKKLAIIFPHNSTFVHVDFAQTAAPPGTPPPPGAPGIPPMPAMPGASGASELKKTDQTRTIQGMECTLYTLSDRGQNFEIWAASDSTLFPFRLLQREYRPRRFGPPMIEEQWVELLQKKSLFPLEATLRSDPGGQERLSFKVSHIDRKRIEPGNLFSVPKDFYEIPPRQF